MLELEEPDAQKDNGIELVTTEGTIFVVDDDDADEIGAFDDSFEMDDPLASMRFEEVELSPSNALTMIMVVLVLWNSQN
jgi:hypothetical protein